MVVGVVDWGLDCRPSQLQERRRLDPAARPLGPAQPRPGRASPEPYGYGPVYGPDRDQPGAGQPRPVSAGSATTRAAGSGESGSHGTHVIDIAAGNGRGGGPGRGGAGGRPGLRAPGRPGHRRPGQPRRLGAAAGGRRLHRPRRGRPAVGDQLQRRPAWAVRTTARCWSSWRSTSCCWRGPAGSSCRAPATTSGRGTHASGILEPGRAANPARSSSTRPTARPTSWRSGTTATDELRVSIDPPGRQRRTDRRGSAPRPTSRRTARLVGRVYHRAHDPNNGDHHIDAFLYPEPDGRGPGRSPSRREPGHAAAGSTRGWSATRRAPRARRGSRRTHASLACTTGTIANGRVPLVVGAYDARRSDPSGRRGPAAAGQTRDGQRKPDLGAPGVAVRRRPLGRPPAADQSRRHRPQVGHQHGGPARRGAVALCLQARAAGSRAQQIRTLVLGTADPPRTQDPELRLGHGYLDIGALLRVTQRAFAAAP